MRFLSNSMQEKQHQPKQKKLHCNHILSPLKTNSLKILNTSALLHFKRGDLFSSWNQTAFNKNGLSYKYWFYFFVVANCNVSAMSQPALTLLRYFFLLTCYSRTLFHMKKQVRTINRAFVPQVKMLIIVGIITFLFSSDCLYHPLIE